MTGTPLTPGQLAILRAARAGGRRGLRAKQIADLSAASARGIYALLGRLVARRLLHRSSRQPPTYPLTEAGERWISASEQYHKALGR